MRKKKAQREVLQGGIRGTRVIRRISRIRVIRVAKGDKGDKEDKGGQGKVILFINIDTKQDGGRAP